MSDFAFFSTNYLDEAIKETTAFYRSRDLGLAWINALGGQQDAEIAS